MKPEHSLQPVQSENGQFATPVSATRSYPTAYAATRGGARRHDLEQLVSPQFLWRALCQWWKLVVPLSVLLAITSSAVVWHHFEPVFRAAAWLRIEGSTPYLAYQLGQDFDESERLQFVQTQLELLRSPLVLGPLVSQPRIAELPEIQGSSDPVAVISSQIGIEAVGDSALFQLQYNSPDPTIAALVVNAVLDGYFRLVGEKAAERDRRVIELLEQEKERRSSEVVRLRARMRELGKDILGKDPFAGHAVAEQVLAHPIAALHERLTNAEVERRVLEAEILAYEDAGEQTAALPVPDAVVDLALERNQQVQELKALIAAKRASLHQIAANAVEGEDAPSYRRTSGEIDNLEKALSELRVAARPLVTEELRANAALAHETDLQQMRSRLASQKVLEQLLQERYQQQLQDVGDSGDQSLELEFTRAELAREERVFELIAQRIMALRTEMRAPGRVTLMSRAKSPSTPVQAYPLTGLALSVLASLCVPLFGAVAWEYRIRRVTDSEQLERLPQLPVLAEVSKLPLRATRGSGRLSKRTGRAVELFEESIDNLRTCIILPEDHQGIQVLAVASAAPGEGKTSVASQLAGSIARSTGQATLLIDADMRSPDLHRIFDIENEPGLAALLEGKCSLEEAIVTRTSCGDSVHLLPAGKLQSSPHKLLGANVFQEVLREARLSYRHIIIDTPPILAASEALVLIKEADGTVLCAMRERSREDQVQLAYDRLLVAGGRPIGAVLNAVPVSRYAFVYGSYSYPRQAV